MFGAIHGCDIPVVVRLVSRSFILMVLERPDVFVSSLPIINDNSKSDFSSLQYLFILSKPL